MKKSVFAITTLLAVVAQAEMLDRPTGIRVGQRMTIRPYVSLYYTWDSNPDSSVNQGSFSSFCINPGLALSYKAENWSIEGGGYYQYHAYTENPQNMDQSSWGENLAFNWTNSKDGSRGWSFVLREYIQKISEDDDMTNDGGRGIGRDRMQMQFATALQRRFTDRLHGDINASYYYLEYDNDHQKYAPLYGWTRWTVGGQIGYAASKWTDFVLEGNYQGFTQDNCSYWAFNPEQVSGNSQGYTIHGGIGSYATERISYRITGGYSYFGYSDGNYKDGSFTYTATAQWRMTDTWNMMIMASSYYQPDETRYATMNRTDALSWGVAHSMVRNKLKAVLDLTYRHNKRSACYDGGVDSTDNTIAVRFGLDYALNRFLSVFGRVEYQTSFYDYDGNAIRDAYNWDYDRWRLTAGIRLTY